MRKITFTICIAAFIMMSCNNKTEETKTSTDSTATAGAVQVKKETPPETMPDSVAIAKAQADFKTPGEMHKWMEKTNGSWEAELSTWTDPSAPPMKSTGTVYQTSVLGGRYVISKFSGVVFGKRTEGQGTMGYDNARKIFVSTWIDNQGTGIVYMTGTYDSTTRTLNLRGFETDPVTGKENNIREEMTMIDNDSYTMTMFGDGPGGKEMKFMEGLYKRKK